jgi:hypothetical protein
MRRMHLDHLVVVVLSSFHIIGCGSDDRVSNSTDAGPEPGERADGGVSSFACRTVTPENPEGLKPIRYVDSSDSVFASANWRVAVEPDTRIETAAFPQPEALESAMLLDLADPAVQVAGFLVARAAGADGALAELDRVQTSLGEVAEVDTLTTRVSGSHIVSLDGFDTVVSTVIEIRTSSAMDSTELRAALVPALLERAPDSVDLPPVGWQSGNDNRFILVLQTLVRADDGQALFMGGVARGFDYEDRDRATGLHADDLANGTGLTESLNGEARECEDDMLDHQGSADVLWVVDQSGSMSDDLDRIADDAEAFFWMANDLGLDFRMGVTDMNDSSSGVFATRNADGSGERWIMPDEASMFAAAIRDPSGPAASDGLSENGLTQIQAALSHHLPRGNAGGLGVRSDAQLAVIVVTDEKAEEVEEAGILFEGNTQPDAEEEAAIMTLLAPYQAALVAEHAVVHLISEPLPFGSTCSTAGAEHAFGYYELVTALGGQMASICQTDLGATLDAMLDSIVGDASPLVLDYVPISSTITVMRNLAPVPRSRRHGWDYRASSNSIIFYGMPVNPAQPAEITIAYRRWKEQIVE